MGLSTLETLKNFQENTKISLKEDVVKIQKFLDNIKPKTYKVFYENDNFEFITLFVTLKGNPKNLFTDVPPFLTITIMPKFSINIESKLNKSHKRILKEFPEAFVPNNELEQQGLIEMAYDFLKTEFIEGEF